MCFSVSICEDLLNNLNNYIIQRIDSESASTKKTDQIFGTIILQTRVMTGIGVAAWEAKAIARPEISPLQKVALILGSGLSAVIVHIILFNLIN